MAKRALAKQSWTTAPQARWTEQTARRLLDDWDKSGESAAAFARRLGVIPQRLFWWRKRLGRAAKPEPGTRLVPVTVRPPAAASFAPSVPVVVMAGESIRVEVREVDARTAAWVAVLVGQLGEARS